MRRRRAVGSLRLDSVGRNESGACSRGLMVGLRLLARLSRYSDLIARMQDPSLNSGQIRGKKLESVYFCKCC